MNKEDKATQQQSGKMPSDEMQLQEKKSGQTQSQTTGQTQFQQPDQTQSQGIQPPPGQAYETQSYRAQVKENEQDGTKTYEVTSQRTQFHAIKPEDSESQETLPQGTQAHGIQSHQGSQSQGTQPHGIQSQGSQSQGTQPHGIQSHQGSQLQGTQPQGTQSHGTQLQGTESQGSQEFHRDSQPYRIRPEAHEIQSQGTQTRAMHPHASQLHGTQAQPYGQQSQGIQSQGIQSKETQSKEAQSHEPQSKQGMDTKTLLPTMENLSLSDTWSQPLPDAKGSVIGKSTYDREDARQDAINLKRAIIETGDAGIDKSVIAGISGGRTFAQRRMIVEEYARLDANKRDLLADLKEALSGDMENVVLPLYMTPGEYDARLMEKAMYGIRNDVDILTEVLCTRTNEEIEAMKRAWTEKIDAKQRLDERVSTETKKLFGVTNFHILCLKLLEAQRPACRKPDLQQVRAEAEDLHHFLLETSDVNGAKAKFVEVFTERSWSHLGAVVGEFQTISGKHTMEYAISKAFSDSSNTTKALRVISEFCFQPYDFWAKKLRDAMKGAGTDDTTLARIIVTRCEVDMSNIAKVFGERYGDGTTLRNWIETNTSGYYSQMLLNLCGYF
jgi:hypothetical protein